MDDSELIRFKCACGKRLKADRKFLGRQTNCPNCGIKLTVEPTTLSPPVAAKPVQVDPLKPTKRPGKPRIFGIGLADLDLSPSTGLRVAPSSPTPKRPPNKTLRILKRSALRNLPAVLCLSALCLFLLFRLMQQIATTSGPKMFAAGMLSFESATQALQDDGEEKPEAHFLALDVARKSISRVHDQVRVPSTAGYSWPSVQLYTTKDDRYWLVSGKFDCQNPLGVMLRGHYALAWTDDEKSWLLREFVADEKVLYRDPAWSQIELSLPERSDWPVVFSEDTSR